ncbi:hypothetical protein EPI10_000177 [Gossypium australe]|uniref:Uncharacterized protein n=1 Tax=Gossypium australe TaxID=47621 RepID=A0A5B6V6V2_9ROSI|nr:hypothetical protein EPI10_000177 [Gossypium australe]
MTYGELHQNLFDEHVVSPFYLKPLQPPYLKWYDPSAQCDYHAGITGHSIENCTAFKKVVEKLIKMGIVEFREPIIQSWRWGINAIGENVVKRTNEDISEVKTPLRTVWKEIVKKGLIKSSFEEEGEGEDFGNYCEFHKAEGHEIKECAEFRLLVQSLMNNEKMKF